MNNIFYCRFCFNERNTCPCAITKKKKKYFQYYFFVENIKNINRVINEINYQNIIKTRGNNIKFRQVWQLV